MNNNRAWFLIQHFIKYFLPFFVVMILFDLGFEDQIEWMRNVLSALVFAVLMTYFRTK